MGVCTQRLLTPVNAFVQPQVEDVENPVAHQLEIYFCRLVCESGLSNLDYHPV